MAGPGGQLSRREQSAKGQSIMQSTHPGGQQGKIWISSMPKWRPTFDLAATSAFPREWCKARPRVYNVTRWGKYRSNKKGCIPCH